MTKELVYLAQSDTTAGFLSADSAKLARLKGRSDKKPTLLTVDSLRELQKHVRVPTPFKNRVRRAHRSSFIYPNNIGIRVVKDERHLGFLSRFGALYSTSANPSGGGFLALFAYEACDVVVAEGVGIFEGKSSQIWKLGRTRCRKIRG